MFDWSDFSVIADSPDASINLSERECNFLLSLLVYAQDRDKWPDVSDADWDSIEAFLAEIDSSLMGAF